MNIPKVESSTQAFKGKIVTIEVDTLSNGGDERFTRETAVTSDSVAVVALNESDNILLIKQYRHPIRRAVWEIPAGRMDVAGESPQQAALRELEEETDTTASTMYELTAFNNSSGLLTEKTYLFLARDLSSVPAFARSEEEADIEKEWVPLLEAFDRVKAGTIDDAKTMIGILLAVEEVYRKP